MSQKINKKIKKQFHKEKYNNHAKKYKDWRAALRINVRENWQKLWWHDGEQFLLTSKGQQAMAAFKTKGEK